MSSHPQATCERVDMYKSWISQLFLTTTTTLRISSSPFHQDLTLCFSYSDCDNNHGIEKKWRVWFYPGSNLWQWFVSFVVWIHPRTGRGTVFLAIILKVDALDGRRQYEKKRGNRKKKRNLKSDIRQWTVAEKTWIYEGGEKGFSTL